MQPRLLKEPIRLAGLPLLRLQSDERLVRLVQDGHGPAFSALVDRYRPSLLRYCTRLVGEQRAEDAVQQAFVNAHRALTEQDVSTTDLRAWLYRIAHNAALNLLRGDRDDWSLDDPQAAGATLTRRSDDVVDTVERREHLARTLAAISALPAPQRDALVLRELEGRSHVEIAGALGVTAGAARQHLMRARAAVRSAAAAVTPYPLVARVAEAMTAGATGERAAAAAGAGLGAGLTKLTAGLLAGGALVGGAAVGTGVAPSPLHSRHHAAPAGGPGATAVPIVAAGEAAAATRASRVPVALRTAKPVPSSHHGGPSRHGTGSRRGGSGHGGDDHTTGDDARSATGAPGHGGDDSGSGGSGSPGSSGSSGTSDHRTSEGSDSPSGSSDDRTGGSGTSSGGSDSSSYGSGSSSGGSDDATTATTATTSTAAGSAGEFGGTSGSGSSDTFEDSHSGSTPTVPLATSPTGTAGSGSSGGSGSDDGLGG